MRVRGRFRTRLKKPHTTERFLTMTRRLLSATLGVAALASVSIVFPARAATLKVDDDGVQCPGAPYTTLQAAVAAAAPGDKIKVCPGNYGGQVVINVPLKIFGKAPKPKTCDTLAALDPTRDSIFTSPPVAGLAGIGIDVLADKVTIQGLAFTGAGETAIRTDPANVRFALKNSVFTANANGIYFHSAAGSKSTVKGNCFHQNGTGVRVGYGLRDASIAKNYFFDSNVAAGIIIDQLTPDTNDRIKVTGNRSTNDATFAVVLGTVDSTFSKNKITGNPADPNAGTAVFIGGNNTRLAITGNTITTAATTALRFDAFYFPGYPPGGPSSSVSVTKNVIDSATRHGIYLDSFTGEPSLVNSSITKNKVLDSGQGGAGDGIRVDDPLATGSNSGNTIDGNAISGSANHDCHDPSTANTWSNNTAATQSAANLCFTGPANGVPEP